MNLKIGVPSVICMLFTVDICILGGICGVLSLGSALCNVQCSLVYRRYLFLGGSVVWLVLDGLVCI